MQRQQRKTCGVPTSGQSCAYSPCWRGPSESVQEVICSRSSAMEPSRPAPHVCKQQMVYLTPSVLPSGCCLRPGSRSARIVQNRAKELAPQRSHPDSMAASLHAKKFTPTRCGDCKEMTGCDVVNHNVAVLVHTLTGPQHAKGVLLRNYNPCTGRKHQPQVHPAMHTACKWRSVTHCVHRIPGPCRCELQRAYSGW